MISAGEGFKTVGACDTSQCQTIKSKLEDGCNVAAGKMREEPKLATTTYQEFLSAIGPVELSDGTVVDPSKGLDWTTMAAVSGACYNFFMERSNLPGMMPAYKPVYEDADVVDADLKTYEKQMKNVKDKTIEECASEGGIPDSSGGCKKCDGDEKPQGGKCVEVDDGTRSHWFAPSVYVTIPLTEKGYGDIGLGSGGYDDFGLDSGSEGSQTSNLQAGFAVMLALQSNLTGSGLSGLMLHYGAFFSIAYSSDVKDAKGRVERQYDYFGNVAGLIGTSYTFQIKDSVLLDIGLDTTLGGQFYDLSTEYQGPMDGGKFAWLLMPRASIGLPFNGGRQAAFFDIYGVFETPLTKLDINPVNTEFSNGGGVKFGQDPQLWVGFRFLL